MTSPVVLQATTAFAYHQVSESLVRSLLSADESRDGMTELVRTALSSRRLLLDSVLRQVASLGLAEPEHDQAWELLARAEEADSAAVRGVLLDPQTGLWGAQLLRRLTRSSGVGPDQGVPLRVDLGFLGQLAAAAGVSAGLDFTLSVPVRRGAVTLPGLGRAVFAEVDGVGVDAVAGIRSVGGRALISCAGSTVELPTDREADAPGWQGLRRIRVTVDGMALALPVDDLGPYGLAENSPPPSRLDDAAWHRWRRLVSDAWRILVTDHRESAEALQVGLLSLLPMPRARPLRPRSASTTDAFGCVVMSEPDEGDHHAAAVHTAVTLVHEIRHSMLNGLIFSTALFGECKELFHAPWRDDPRPLGGLVHGAYSFAGVVRFWRERVAFDRGAARELAQFEFGLWRRQTDRVLAGLQGHPDLTPLGQQLTRVLAERLEPWLAEPVEPRQLRLAELAAAHHRTVWRGCHQEADLQEVARLVEAWTAGRGAEPRTPGGSVLRPDDRACRLDVLALLARMRLAQPERFAALRAAPEQVADQVEGAGPGDLALIEGETEEALRLYRAEFAAARGSATGEPRPAVWAGLGAVLAERGDHGDLRDARAAALLADRPELVAELYRTLGGPAGEQPVDPVRLVRGLVHRPAESRVGLAVR